MTRLILAAFLVVSAQRMKILLLRRIPESCCLITGARSVLFEDFNGKKRNGRGQTKIFIRYLTQNKTKLLLVFIGSDLCVNQEQNGRVSDKFSIQQR